MNTRRYYLGDTFTSIVERMEELNRKVWNDEITNSEWREQTDAMKDEITSRPERLDKMVFECLTDIALEDSDWLELEANRLHFCDIYPRQLDMYFRENGCRGFMLLADSPNLAEYAVNLQNEMGWKTESVYVGNVFQGVKFTR